MQVHDSKCYKSNNEIQFKKSHYLVKLYQPNGQNSQNNNSKLNKKISTNQKEILDIFTSKDIQEEIKEITKIFQNRVKYYINNSKEDIKNEFIIKVANAARRAYNNSNELFINMFKEFLKFREEEKNISSLKNDEHLRKKIYSLVKQYEKSPEGKKKMKIILIHLKVKDNMLKKIIFLYYFLN